MELAVLQWLSTPITWFVAIMMVALWSRFFRRARKKRTNSSRIVRLGSFSPAAVGAALLFLSVTYRPSHTFIAKAQIQQQEDADDDDQGGPDTPKKHMHRQLRRIRRGETVETLVWRLE